jgi:hypothetical protein
LFQNHTESGGVENVSILKRHANSTGLIYLPNQISNRPAYKQPGMAAVFQPGKYFAFHTIYPDTGRHLLLIKNPRDSSIAYFVRDAMQLARRATFFAPMTWSLSWHTRYASTMLGANTISGRTPAIRVRALHHLDESLHHAGHGQRQPMRCVV